MYLFSKSAKAFFPLVLQELYEARGTWPNDGIEVSRETYAEFSSSNPGYELDAADDGTPCWTALPQPLLTASGLRAAITSKRWQIETGGLTLHTGVHVATGIDDQNRITSVIANAELAGVESVDFKAASGWVSVTVAELKAVAAAIALHVQQCFTAERVHHEAIDALEQLHAEDAQALQQALAAYDIEQGWPSTEVAS